MTTAFGKAVVKRRYGNHLAVFVASGEPEPFGKTTPWKSQFRQLV
jgi:hypothetical protein